MPEFQELCVTRFGPNDPVQLDEQLRELGLGRLRRAPVKGAEPRAAFPEQTSAYAFTLLPDGGRGYWIDLHSDDPTILPEVTALLEEEGWEVLSYPFPTDSLRGGPPVAGVIAEAPS